MKIFAVFVACVLLTGCASVQPYKAAIAQKAAEASDQIQADSEWMFCRGYSVGAWVRRFGNDPSGADAWRQLCLRGATEAPAK